MMGDKAIATWMIERAGAVAVHAPPPLDGLVFDGHVMQSDDPAKLVCPLGQAVQLDEVGELL